MDLQDRYDELDNIISSLDILINDIADKSYIEQIEEIKYQAQEEKEQIEPLLQEMYEQEERQTNIEYERSVV